MKQLIENRIQTHQYYFSNNWYFYFSIGYFYMKKILKNFIRDELKLKTILPIYMN